MTIVNNESNFYLDAQNSTDRNENKEIMIGNWKEI